jgi:signal transduction histidine kinase
MRRLRTLLAVFLQLSFLHAGAQSSVNDSLLQIVQENKQDASEINALNALATNYSRTDMVKAEFYLRRAIELAGKSNYATQLSSAYAQMVTLQMNLGRVDTAQYYLSTLKKLADESGLAKVKQNYNYAAGLFYKMQGNAKAALPFMKEALSEAAQLVKEDPSVSNKTALAGQNLNIGNTQVLLGDYKDALQYHLKALQLFEELNNKKGISFCYQDIGLDFFELQQYNHALSYTKKSLDIKSELNDQRGIATSLTQMGGVCQGLNQYDSALAYYFKSLKMVEEMKLTTEEEKINFSIGEAYGLKKDSTNAGIYYRKSKLLAQQLGDSSRSAEVDAALIALQTTMNKEQKDEKKLLTSLNASIEAGDKNSELRNYQHLADHYAQNHQFDKALEYSDKYHLANDSMASAGLQLQMKKMEEEYNVDKKEKEIALLKKEQQLNQMKLQKEKSFQLGAAILFLMLLLIGFLIINRYRVVHRARRAIEMERMRNSIARDLHDDIGSTLSSINVLSGVTLQSHDIQEQTMRSNLQKIKERSGSIMESMDDIVWAINPMNDTMEQLFFRMQEFAAELLEPLHINYKLEDKGSFSAVRLDVRRRKDFYLLFKEALNNAAKYSGCNNLLISLAQQQHVLHLEIVDDGKGFAKEEIVGGNGLNNMKERAASMGANILIDSAIGKGTRIALDLEIT